jgi:hypothetical protein
MLYKPVTGDGNNNTNIKFHVILTTITTTTTTKIPLCRHTQKLKLEFSYALLR